MRRAAALIGLVLLAALPAAPAHAQEDGPQTGWWSRSRVGAPSPVEAPVPLVPSGGTWVSGGSNGVVALSALRLALPEGAVPTGIALEVADLRGTPQVQACAAVSRWEPNADGRPIDQAPAADCDTVSATGTVVDGRLVVPLEAVAGPVGGVLDVVLRPAPGSAFSLTLQPATPSSVTTRQADEPVASADPFDPAGAGAGGDAFAAPPSLSSASDGLPPFDSGDGAAALPLLPDALPEPAVPSDPAVAAPVAAGPALGRLPTRPSAAAPLDDGRTALAATVALLALGVLAVRLAGTPVAAPAALGGAARLRAAAGAGAAPPAVPTAVRGVGRFRTERAGRPTPV